MAKDRLDKTSAEARAALDAIVRYQAAHCASTSIALRKGRGTNKARIAIRCLQPEAA